LGGLVIQWELIREWFSCHFTGSSEQILSGKLSSGSGDLIIDKTAGGSNIK